MLFSLPLFSQDKVREEIEKRATKLFEEGQYLAALPDYRQLLSSDPEDADLNFHYGACVLASDEDPEVAVKHLSFAVKSFSIDPRAYYFLGQAYHMDYRFADAEKSYQRFFDKADDKVKSAFPETQRLIVMAENGKQLLSNIKDIKVISKTESTAKDFFRNYEMKEVGGSIITVPEELLSAEDKKRGHRPLMHFDSNKSTCYFSSYGKGADLDIYSAVRSSNGSFSKPIEVIGPINTEYDEDYPFMHEDGSTLYFSSKGHNSMGGFDIFSADIGTGEVKNMDFAISSADDDIFYVVDKKRMWANFASSRNSEAGRLHVYQVKVSDAPLELALVSGKVINEVGGLAAARIKVVDAKSDEVVGNYQSDTNGDYLIDLPGMGKYMFYIDVTGSDLTHVGTVDVPSFGEVRAFKQEMSLVEVGGQEKLLIKNNFEESVEGDILTLAQDILKRKADLQVNADADELLALQDNTKTILPEEELLIRAGFRRDTGMDVVMALGYDQAEKLKKGAKAEETERGKTAGILKKEIDESLTLANQAQAIYQKYSASEIQSEKEAFLVQAASLRLQSEGHAFKAEEAMKLLGQLDESISSKVAATQELESRNAKLESEIFNANNDAVITLLREIKETDDSGLDKLDILDYATADAQAKRKESTRILARLQEIQEARDRVQASYKMKEVQINRSEKAKDKDIMQAEADALQAELADLNEQVQKTVERLEKVQTEADVSSGALSLLERIRVAEDEELAGVVSLDRADFDIEAEQARVASIAAINDETVIVQDELTYALVNQPELLKAMNSSDFLKSYGISQDLLSSLEESSSLNSSPSEADLRATQSAFLSKEMPSYESSLAALDLSAKGSQNDLKEAIELKKDLSAKVQSELSGGTIEAGQRVGLEVLFQRLAEEVRTLESRLEDEAIASSPEASDSSFDVMDVQLVGMDEATFETWMSNAAKANIEDISRSNAKILSQGEPESLKTPSGLAGRMEKHANYVQMVNGIRAERQKSLVNNPASGSKVHKELEALDEVISVKAQVMSRELREWEKQSNILLTEQERLWALNDPRYLQERTSIESMDLSSDERVEAIDITNAEMKEANRFLLIDKVPQVDTSTELDRAEQSDGNDLSSVGRNMDSAEAGTGPQPGLIGSFDEVLSDVIGAEIPKDEDVFVMESYFTNTDWNETLFANEESREELESTLPTMEEYLNSNETMDDAKRRYNEDVISMSMATPTAKEFKSRLESFSKPNKVSQSWVDQARIMFGRADELRMDVTTEQNLFLVNQKLREALFMEMKALDLLNKAQAYENHLASQRTPASFQYSEAIVLNYGIRPELDFAENLDKAIDRTENSARVGGSEKSIEEESKLPESPEEPISDLSGSGSEGPGKSLNKDTATEAKTLDQALEMTETNQQDLAEVNKNAQEEIVQKLKGNPDAEELPAQEEEGSLPVMDTLDNEELLAESIDTEVPELMKTEDLEDLIALDRRTAQSTYPKAVSTLAQMDLNAPQGIENSIEVSQSQIESVTIEPQVAAQLSPEELETLKVNKAQSIAVESYEQELKLQQVTYQEAIQQRRLRIAEVIDITPEKRSTEQRLELKKLTAETLVLESYLADAESKMALNEDRRSELRTAEAKLALQLVNSSSSTAADELTTDQVTDSTLPEIEQVVPNEIAEQTKLGEETVKGVIEEGAIVGAQELEADGNVVDIRKSEVTLAEDKSKSSQVNETPKEELNTSSTDPSTDREPSRSSQVDLNNETTAELTRPEVILPVANEPIVETLSAVPSDWVIPEVLLKNVFALTPSESKRAEEKPFAPVPVSALPAGLVYQVQVGAFRNSIPDSQFDAFRPVMKEALNSGITRYTVGLFLNESSASNAKDRVRGMGYSDAFVVAYRDGKRVSLVEARSSSTPSDLARTVNADGKESFLTYTEPQGADGGTSQTKSSGTSTSGQTKSTSAPIETDSQRLKREEDSRKDYYALVENAAPANQVELIEGLFYTVQVGLYSKPVTSSAIYNLSPLNSELMDNGQVKYTSGIFDNLDLASNWKDNVVERGVQDAFVTAYYNGKRISISKSKELLQGDDEVAVNLDELSDLERDREGQAIWEMVSTSELFGEAVKESVIFKIRIGPYTDRIPDKDVRVILDFEDNVEYGRKEDGTIIYTTKGVMSYEEAQKWRKTFLDEGITNANIVAFRDGEEIDVKQALDFLLK